MVPIAEKIGCVPQALHEWMKKGGVDSGKRGGAPTEVTDKVKALECEVREPRQANEILRRHVLSPSKGHRHISLRRRSTAATGDDRYH